MKNFEIELVLTMLNKPDSIFRTSRFSPSTRYALKTFTMGAEICYRSYMECRKEMIDEYVSNGKIIEERGNYSIKPEYVSEISKELEELMMANNELDVLSEKAVSEILKLDLTMEEDYLVCLMKGSINNESNSHNDL